MTQIVPKLDDLLETMPIPGFDSPVTFSAINLDDVFLVLKEKGIDDVKVTWGQMFLISTFLVANMKHNPSMEDDDMCWKSLEIMREGKVDKYLGVNLHLLV